MRAIFAMTLMTTLAACVTEVAPTPDPAASCGADALQGLVGQPESVLAAMTFAQPVRILHPDTPMTMDYQQDRLNIVVDAKGKITAVRCS